MPEKQRSSQKNSSGRSSSAGKRSSNTAASGRKTASSRSAAAKKRAAEAAAARKEAVRKKQQQIARTKEITVILLAGIAVLFTISCFAAPLDWLKRFSYSVFGIMMYVLPLFFAGLVGFLLYHEFSGRLLRKLIAAFVVLFSLQGVLSVAMKVADGGLLGRLNYFLLNRYLGTIGTYVVDVILICIGIVLFTDYSLFNLKDDEEEDDEEEAGEAETEKNRGLSLDEKDRYLHDEKYELKQREAAIRKEEKRAESLRKKEEKNRELARKLAERERRLKIQNGSFSPVTGIGDTKILAEVNASETKVIRTGQGRKAAKASDIVPVQETEPVKEDVLKDFPDIHVPSEFFRKEEKDAEDILKDTVIDLNLPWENDIDEALMRDVDDAFAALDAPETVLPEEDPLDLETEPLFPEDRIPAYKETETLPDPEEPVQRVRSRVRDPLPDNGIKTVVTSTGKIISHSVDSMDPRKGKEVINAEKDRQEAEKIASQMTESLKKEPLKEYEFPPITLLTKGAGAALSRSDLQQELRENAAKLQQTLKTFGVEVTITNISCGPAVTRYEIQPAMGVKVSRIVSLTDDIKLNLAAADIRMEAPIPGKSAIGIEIPNKTKQTVALRDILESQEFTGARSKLSFAAGRDIEGNTIVANIAKMPHVLVAGATGSGKSVCINSIIMSILYHAKPTEVKMIMVDPKVVELAIYNGIPHLLMPVVTEPRKAAAALNWAVAEMERRYQLFAQYGVRSFEGFNEMVDVNAPVDENGENLTKMPQILIIVDELADLMMVASNEVEDAICRLAQKARAAGLHLVLATQRPSVDVITGLIKANIPSRIAFAVSSGTDSRTILDMNGAEKLLGMGDMLYAPAGASKPIRVQGAFVSDGDVKKVVDFITAQGPVEGTSDASGIDLSSASAGFAGADRSSEIDEYFVEAGRLVIEKEKATIGMLQRAFKLGFNRAARIMDQLCEAGVVGEEEGTKPRRVIMKAADFEEYLNSQ